MNIRPITAEALPEVVHVGHSFFTEARLPGGFKPECFIKNWTPLIEKGIGVFLGGFEGEKFVGGIGGVLAPDLNNDEVIAVECFWYVLPEHRGGGLRLLKAFEAWAKARGADRVAMIHLTNVHPEEMRSLYERLGYSAVEVNYHKYL